MAKPILAAFLSCQGTQLSDDEKVILNQSNPVGLTLFARNIKNKIQLKHLIHEIKEVIGRDNVLIAIDQEGGRVRRLKEPEFRPYSSQCDIGCLDTKQAIIAAQIHAQLISSDLHNLGINVNYAPVLDIAYPQTTEALRSRCFSNSAKTISILGAEMIKTYTQNGIISCIKHMPGHGLSVSDPHLGLPIIDISLEELQYEMQPFKDCNFAPFGMTAHILLPQIDDKFPLTQSKTGIQNLIREQIGFNGLLISDAIDMKALKGSITEKAQLSLSAGCDCVCYCMGNIAEMHELVQNCPYLSDIANERLDKSLQILHNRFEVSDLTEKVATYNQLMGQITPYKDTYDATEVLHNMTDKGIKNV